MKLLKIYKDILKSLDVEVDEYDRLVYTFGGEPTPVTLTYNHDTKGKTKGELYLPTKKICGLEESPKVVKFHPTGESLLRGNSEVQNRIIMLMTTKLSFTAICLIDTIFKLACDNKLHGNLSMKEAELIAGIDLPIGKRDIDYWNKIKKQITSQRGANNPILRIRVDRDSTLMVDGKEEQFNRIATMNPVLSKAFKDPQSPKFGGKPPNKKAFDNIKAIIDFVLKTNSQFAGVSRDMTAPTLEASLRLFIEVAEHFEDIIDMIESIYDKSDKEMDLSNLRFHLVWKKDIKKLVPLHNKELPITFPANKGAGAENTGGSAASEPAIANLEKATMKLKNAGISGTHDTPAVVEQLQKQESDESEFDDDDMSIEAMRARMGIASNNSDTGASTSPKPNVAAVEQVDAPLALQQPQQQQIYTEPLNNGMNIAPMNTTTDAGSGLSLEDKLNGNLNNAEMQKAMQTGVMNPMMMSPQQQQMMLMMQQNGMMNNGMMNNTMAFNQPNMQNMTPDQFVVFNQQDSMFYDKRNSQQIPLNKIFEWFNGGHLKQYQQAIQFHYQRIQQQQATMANNGMMQNNGMNMNMNGMPNNQPMQFTM